METLVPLAAFESIRRVLGHTATLRGETLNRLWDEAAASSVELAEYTDAREQQRLKMGWPRPMGGEPTQESQLQMDPELWGSYLAAVAVELRRVWRDQLDPDRSDPVLPQVDVARGRVSHTTCTGRTTVAVRRWENGGRYHPPELSLTRHGDPLNLSASRDLALLALVRLAGGELCGEEDAATIGAPDGECVFRAFLTLRHAGLGEDVAAAALTHLGHTVDVAAIAERVLSWRDCQDFDERRRLHAATRLYGEAPEWEPLPGGGVPKTVAEMTGMPAATVRSIRGPASSAPDTTQRSK